MSVIESIKAKVEEINKKREEHLNEVRQGFPAMFAEFFAKSTIKSLTWQQYTPYFNDGEECEFSANVRYLVINIGEDNEDDEAGLTHEDKKLLDEVKETLCSIDQNFYRDLFGNHVEVTLTAEGVEVVEYSDHD